MDLPVSAFEIYKVNKKNIKQVKRKRNRKNRTPQNKASDKLNDVNFEIEVARKIKEKQKKGKESKLITKRKTHKKGKESKLITKRKTHKKKKAKNTENKQSKIDTMNSESSASESADVPVLVPLSKTTKENAVFKTLEPDIVSDHDDISSQSSHGSIEFTPLETNSRDEGLKVFKWMIAPHDPKTFLDHIWEKKPLHIARSNPKYYKDIINTPAIDNMLRKENIQFTKNLDITSYVNGERETHNPEGRALPHLVWDYYLNGCSVRLLNPQTYISKLHVLNATLQEFFNSFVGANAYLTPPNSQGFAPHYDDIEAFILQTEGKKLWKVYKPRSENEVLPRVSSKNFNQDEIGEPILEVTLEAGDMLYFPRGFIHQGVTVDGKHSLHVTVSMYQKHSWADLFEKMLPSALQLAVSENVEFRQGLPLDIYDNLGIVNADMRTPRRAEIEKIMKTLFDKIRDHLPMDDAVDQMNKNFQYDALPPVLNDVEKAVTVFGDSDLMIRNGKVINRVEIGLDTRVRLLRKNILRMVSEEECLRLYFHIENSLEYHGTESSFIEIDEHSAPGIDALITAYPEYVTVETLDLPNDSDKLDLVDALWSRGLIMTEYPLENIDDD